jgi:hypothetical protein
MGGANLSHPAEAEIGQALSRPGAEGLFPLWRIDLGKPDFDLLPPTQDGQGVAVGDADDRGLIGGGRADQSDQEQGATEFHRCHRVHMDTPAERRDYHHLRTNIRERKKIKRNRIRRRPALEKMPRAELLAMMAVLRDLTSLEKAVPSMKGRAAPLQPAELPVRNQIKSRLEADPVGHSFHPKCGV